MPNLKGCPHNMRQVSMEQGESLAAEYGLTYREVCTIDNRNLDEIRQEVLLSVFKAGKQFFLAVDDSLSKSFKLSN